MNNHSTIRCNYCGAPHRLNHNRDHCAYCGYSLRVRPEAKPGYKLWYDPVEQRHKLVVDV